MHAVAGWVHAVAGWVHTCYMYDCRFGHHHIVDPRTGQLLKCGREAPALAAVEAASCALADALATALLVAGSVAEARGWICEAAAAGQLPAQVTRIWLCCREDMQLLCFEPHAEARAAAAAAALRRALRAVPHPVPPPSCKTLLRTHGYDPVHPRLRRCVPRLSPCAPRLQPCAPRLSPCAPTLCGLCAGGAAQLRRDPRDPLLRGQL